MTDTPYPSNGYFENVIGEYRLTSNSKEEVGYRRLFKKTVRKVTYDDL
jgi:hypothetical protein